MKAQTEIQKSIDELEFLHQKLKEEYIRWASNRTDRGIGFINNSVTIEFIRNYTDVYRKKRIKENLRYISNTMKNTDERMAYSILREVYFMHPSFHENWFYESHLIGDFKAITKKRLGLKAYLTSKGKGTLEHNKQGITTMVLKYTILLENLTCSKLSYSLMDDSISPSKNIENDIKEILNVVEKIENENAKLNPQVVVKEMPRLFRIVRYLLKKTNYRQLKSDALLSLRTWLEYAPCSINEGPIFYKKSEKTRIEIFKECPSLDEDGIRKYLREYFEIKEYPLPKVKL